MNRFKTLLLLVLTITIALPAFSADKIDSKIRFNDLYGEVKIKPNADEDSPYEFAELDTIIYEDDRIKTEEESGAILGLEDMSTYVVKPESELVIHTEENNVSKIEILAGTMWANLKKMSEGKSLEIEMSQCVCGASGSTIRFEIRVLGDNQTEDRVVVIKGSCDIVDMIKNEVYHLEAGQEATVDGKGVKIIETIVDEAQKELDGILDSSNDKKTTDTLLKQLESQTQEINKAKESLDNTINDINKILQKQKNISQDSLKKLIENFEKKLKEGKRFVSIFVEVNSTINVLNKRGSNGPRNDKVVQVIPMDTINKAIEKANNAINGFGQSLDSLIELGLKLKEMLTVPVATTGSSSTNEIEQKVETIKSAMSNINSQSQELAEDIKDDSSYDDFKSAITNCSELLDDLDELFKEINDEELASHSQTLTTEYDILRKRIEKQMNDYATVPEIPAATLNQMTEFNEQVPGYSTDVRKYLEEYKSIDKSSTDSKKRYVENVTRTLAAYDRMRRVFTKAERLHNQIEQKFQQSKYKTFEYSQVKQYWEDIQESMSSLDSEASELKSCVDALKSQLDQLIGQ